MPHVMHHGNLLLYGVLIRVGYSLASLPQSSLGHVERSWRPGKGNGVDMGDLFGSEEGLEVCMCVGCEGWSREHGMIPQNAVSLGNTKSSRRREVLSNLTVYEY